MATTTKIEWTDRTWNPVRGCALVSEGCRNCYAMKFAHRFSGKGKPYAGLTRLGKHGPVWTGAARFVPEMLAEPLTWGAPQRVFVNSMSDLFHEDITDEQIAEVFGVMAVAGAQEESERESAQAEDGGCFHRRGDGYVKLGKPAPLYRGGAPVQLKYGRFRSGPHTFQVLTKRARRMRDVVASGRFRELVAGAAHRWAMDRRDAGYLSDCISGLDNPSAQGRAGRLWPLPNLWLGVSVEDQAAADERIPLLLETPAAVRFVSAEPLLGPVELSDHLWPSGYESGGPGGWVETSPAIDWVIAGGESGNGARPCALEWLEAIRDQCAAAKVACFVKQLGGFIVSEQRTVVDAEEQEALGLDSKWAWRAGLKDRKGGDWSEWPEELRVRQFPSSDEMPARAT